MSASEAQKLATIAAVTIVNANRAAAYAEIARQAALTAEQLWMDPMLITLSPLVTAASAYVSGNVVGGLQAVSVNAPNGGRVDSVNVVSLSGDDSVLDMFVFVESPDASVTTDNQAFSLVQSDFAKLVPGSPFQLLNGIPAGSPTVRTAGSTEINFPPPASSQLWFVCVTRGTPTYADSHDLTFQLSISASGV